MNLRDSLKNPVPLYNLLRKDVREALEEQIILTENLYYRDVLIIKSGAFLDETLIYKLLNFGFKKVSIVLPEAKPQTTDFENLSILQLKKQLLKTQKCLIADKNAYHINELIAVLTASYINEDNIIAVNNSLPVKKLILEKQPKFVFIDLNLYPKHGLKVIKEISKHATGHVFLTALADESKVELINKLKLEVATCNAQLLLKPIVPVPLRTILLDCVTNSDVKKYLAKKNSSKKRSQPA